LKTHPLVIGLEAIEGIAAVPRAVYTTKKLDRVLKMAASSTSPDLKILVRYFEYCILFKCLIQVVCQLARDELWMVLSNFLAFSLVCLAYAGGSSASEG
jgi:hypothetical protein